MDESQEPGDAPADEGMSDSQHAQIQHDISNLLTKEEIKALLEEASLPDEVLIPRLIIYRLNLSSHIRIRIMT